MINSKGIIQNNRTASDFIRRQRKYNQVYKILSKDEERAMICSYAKLKLDESGSPIYRKDPTTPFANDDHQCEFEWIGDETELRINLVMHNLQAVTKTSTKHCQDTRDYDEMYARGLYGLVRAANEFHPFKLITRTVGHRIDEDGNKIPIKEVVRDKNGNYGFIKFNTFAQFWIFKYVMDEFYAKNIGMDNNSVSMNELVRIHGDSSKGVTFENYIQDSLSPDVEPPRTVAEEVEISEMSSIYDSIHDYISTSSDMTDLERSVLEESFYNGTHSVKKLSSILKIPQKDILDSQISALGKLKDFLYEEYGISSLSDVI